MEMLEKTFVERYRASGDMQSVAVAMGMSEWNAQRLVNEHAGPGSGNELNDVRLVDNSHPHFQFTMTRQMAALKAAGMEALHAFVRRENVLRRNDLQRMLVGLECIQSNTSVREFCHLSGIGYECMRAVIQRLHWEWLRSGHWSYALDFEAIRPLIMGGAVRTEEDLRELVARGEVAPKRIGNRLLHSFGEGYSARVYKLYEGSLSERH